MRLVSLPAYGPFYQPDALRFWRSCEDLQDYYAGLWAHPDFTAAYTAPEQHHIWTIPSGKLVVRDPWDIRADNVQALLCRMVSTFA